MGTIAYIAIIITITLGSDFQLQLLLTNTLQWLSMFITPWHTIIDCIFSKRSCSIIFLAFYKVSTCKF